MTDNDHGFTVLELLIAMAVIAGVVTFLGSVVGFARQYLNRSTMVIETTEEATVLRRILSEELGHVSVDGRGVPLVGARRELTIHTVASRTPALSGRVLLTLTSGDEGDQPLATWRSDAPGQVVSHTLASRGKRLFFSYFGPETGWSSSWSGSNTIPRFVRVTIRDQGTKEADFVFPVRAVLPAQCSTDPRTAQICGASQ